MLRLLRPNLAGWLLMVPCGLVVAFPRTCMTYLPGATVAEVHGELGFPTWFSWDTPGTWHLHAVAIPTFLGLYLAPTLVGAVLSRWRYWRLAPRSLWLFPMVPIVALAVSVTFSLTYWGYAWSLPDLDARVNEVRWTGVTVFTSGDDGTRWTARPREELKDLRTEPAADLECCLDGRILKVVGDRLPAVGDISPAELAVLEAEVLANIELETGEPEYRYARRLRGVVLVGNGADQRPVAFASFSGGEVSNDHHAMYEVLLERGPPSRRLSSSRTYGDFAGIEGLTAGWVASVLSVIGFAAVAVLLSGWTLLAALWRGLAERRQTPT